MKVGAMLPLFATLATCLLLQRSVADDAKELGDRLWFSFVVIQIVVRNERRIGTQAAPMFRAENASCTPSTRALTPFVNLRTFSALATKALDHGLGINFGRNQT